MTLFEDGIIESYSNMLCMYMGVACEDILEFRIRISK